MESKYKGFLAKAVKPVAKQNHFFSQSNDSNPFAH